MRAPAAGGRAAAGRAAGRMRSARRSGRPGGQTRRPLRACDRGRGGGRPRRLGPPRRCRGRGGRRTRRVVSARRDPGDPAHRVPQGGGGAPLRSDPRPRRRGRGQPADPHVPARGRQRRRGGRHRPGGLLPGRTARPFRLRGPVLSQRTAAVQGTGSGFRRAPAVTGTTTWTTPWRSSTWHWS